MANDAVGPHMKMEGNKVHMNLNMPRRRESLNVGSTKRRFGIENPF